MTVYHYIDNEVPAFGEWDARTEVAPSTITQTTEASFPERGAVGLRATIVTGSAAYVQKLLPTVTIAPGGKLAVGFWFRLWAADVNGTGTVQVRFGANTVLEFWTYSSYNITALTYNDAGGSHHTGSQYLGWGRWCYIVMLVQRATTDVAADGRLQLYIDGALINEQTGIDNFDRLGVAGNDARFGSSFYVRTLLADFDEIKIADGYPEPYVPEPLTEYPEARRTIVLYRWVDGDSREFADYCVSQLGIPRANLCPLPNATTDETLADYATFQAQVETDLLAWLARTPTINDNLTTVIVGYNVPGYFMSAGVKHSAASRLMNYPTMGFVSQTDNPLYNPSTVARLTAAQIMFEDMLLATRIDADTLANAKLIVDRGLVVEAIAALPDSDKLYSDDTAYKGALGCQHLRIATSGFTGTLANDAFVWGFQDESWGAAGSRVSFHDRYICAGSSLRVSSSLYAAFITGGYACGLGAADTNTDGTSPSAFFEMLRIGGSFAEAVAVAVKHIQYTTVAAGSPLMTVNFQLGGYNVYRGSGGPEAIDWSLPVAHLRQNEVVAAVPFYPLPNEKHVLAARSVSNSGVEERNVSVLAYAEVDDAGELLPAPLEKPYDVTAEAGHDGSVLVGFSHRSSPGCQSPDAFDIFSDNGAEVMDLNNPIATITEFPADKADFELWVTPAALPAIFAVRARAGQRNGPLSRIVTARQAPAPQAAEVL